jgi:hypothetical protein
MHGPVGPVGVEGAGHAVLREHPPERRHDRARALATLHELGIQDLLRRIVHDDEQGVPGVGDEGEPAVAAAIEVQQFPETRARLAPAAMSAPGSALAHQPGALERGPHEGVGERHPVIPAGQLVEVSHIEALVPLAIEPEDPLELDQRHAAGRRSLAATIEQARDPELLKPRAPAPHRPWAEADDIGDLKPGLATMQGVQKGLVDRHGALHGPGGIVHHHLLGGDSLPRASLERSCHLFSGAAT